MPSSNLRKLILVGYILIAILIVRTFLIDGPSYQGSISDPIQNATPNSEIITLVGESGGVEIELLAEYELEGVVKGKKKYSDYPSQISKYDFIMAWGDLNKKDIDDTISYSQSGRWYYYKYSQDGQVGFDYISTHSANVHLVHKDEAILRLIKDVDKGDHIRMKGYLVNVLFKENPWKTSLSRKDTGNGACEIMLVTKVEEL